jgi:hypothetical protein
VAGAASSRGLTIEPMPMTIIKAIEVFLGLGLLGFGFYVFDKNMNLPAGALPPSRRRAAGPAQRCGEAAQQPAGTC